MSQKINQEKNSRTRAGLVALVGLPNAGKSTLLNAIMGVKLSAVTQKAQTTRLPIRGITTIGQTQIVYIDTPGISSGDKRLQRALSAQAWQAMHEANIVGLLVDARLGLFPALKDLLHKMSDLKEVVLVLNKIDTVSRGELLGLTQQLNEAFPFQATFMISALKADGIQALEAYFATHLPEGAWLFPEDQLSTNTERELAENLTREKTLLYLHDEIPYDLTVSTEGWEVFKNGSVKISQVIEIGEERYKKIILGRGGETVKKIRMEAAEDIAAVLGMPVHLFLHVRHNPRWQMVDPVFEDAPHN